MAPPDRDDARDEEEAPPASLASARTISARTMPALGASDHPPPPSIASAPTVFDTGRGGPDGESGPRPTSSGAPVELRPFGPYSKVVALDAQGSMGWVARGFNEAFGRWELLKFLRPELASEVELIRQFMREGRVLAKLSHPNVVQVFASYSLEGHACLAMEYLEGKSLGELIVEAGGRLSSERALTLLLEAARGLAAAHELGLLHRDIKPDNLFVVEGSRGRAPALKLIDFGLATADRGRPETLMNDPNLDSNAVGGTPLFLAPELWKGQTASPRSDLYALGVTFYYALTGAYPSGPLGIRGLMEYAKSETRAPRVREARPDLMPGLAGLIDRLIAKDPHERVESAALLLHELVALQESARPRRLPGTGPFRGLLPYSESERDVFFGRDAEVAEIAERFRSDSGIVLVGPAGCGKTSLALSGVVPRIREGVLGGGIRFAVAVVEPSRRPLRALGAALNAALGGDEGELERAFEESALRGVDVIRRRLAGAAGLLLVVDQLEELSRVPELASEARRFAEIVARLVENPAPDLRVLACLRVEALDRLLASFDLKQVFARGFVPVQPLSAEALGTAVTRALAVARAQADDDALLSSAVAEVGGLRHGSWLLGLVLASLWRERDESTNTLQVRAYAAQGGLPALLVRHADAVVQAMGERQRAAAEELFARFVDADRRAQRVLRSALLEWRAEASGVLSVLTESRLLVELGDELELVHPALIERWPFLRDAVASHGEDKVLRERVAAAAREWDAQGRPDGALWHGEQADRLVAWFLATEARFGELELEFIARVRQQGVRRRWLRRAAIGLGLALMAVTALVALIGRRDLQAELAVERERATKSRDRERGAMRAAQLRIAELELERDPLAALLAAHQSRALGESPQLDVIGWAARRRGVAVGLPLHAGGAGGVRVTDDERHVLTWGSEALHLLEIAADGRQRVVFPGALPPTALATTPDGAIFGNVRGELFRARRKDESPQPLQGCSGVVRRLVLRETSLLRLVCSNAEQSEYELLELELEGAKRRPLWSRAARVVELDRRGETLAAAHGYSVSGWAESGAAPELSLRAGQTISALAWLGPALVLGTEGGELVIARREGERWKAGATAPGHRGPVRKVAADGEGGRFVSFGDDGRALLFDAELRRVAELAVAGRAAHFLDHYAALALEGPEHHVHVVSATDGRTLAELGPATASVTGIAGNREWLFASSLDGATRAFALHTTLPRRKPSPLAQGEEGRCSLAPDGAAVACLTAKNLRVARLSGKSAPRSELALGAGHSPDLAGPFAVAAGGSHVAWTARGSLFVWNGETVSALPVTEGVAWLAAAPEPGAWLLLRRAGERKLLSVVGRRGEAPPPTALAFEPAAVSLAPDGAAFALDGAGRLFQAPAPEGPYALLEAASQGAPLRAVAADATGRLLFGAESGEVGTLNPRDGKRVVAARLDAPIVSLTPTREDRALIVSDARGSVTLVDLETALRVPLFGIDGQPATCALDTASGDVTCSTARGESWALALDTTPLGFSAAPEDPLDPKTRPFDGWRGLGTH